jgi:hypothetical protein
VTVGQAAAVVSRAKEIARETGFGPVVRVDRRATGGPVWQEEARGTREEVLLLSERDLEDLNAWALQTGQGHAPHHEAGVWLIDGERMPVIVASAQRAPAAAVQWDRPSTRWDWL